MFPITMPYVADVTYKVYCRDSLTDRRNGDYDTRGVLFVKDSKGILTTINRYFKESDNGWVEIDEAEYCQRRDAHLRRQNMEYQAREADVIDVSKE
jgi:hypothetical protein